MNSTVHFKASQSLREFQETIKIIYGLPDDRMYSTEDILTQQRFAMRTLKGIRKNDPEKITLNLMIALSWLMTLSNRLQIDTTKEVWKRFPGICSYCGEKPCVCKKVKVLQRKKIDTNISREPVTIQKFQEMFETIYPSSKRTLADAGIHFAEEVGEVSEAIHNYLGQHLEKQFNDIELEIADEISCIFGVANSAHINIAEELAVMFADGCHICHHAPCECSFSFVSQIKT